MWVRLDDGFFANPKILGLRPEAKLLYLAGLAYCSAQLTDGAITRPALGLLGSMAGLTIDAPVGELVAAGLWAPTAEGYRVHDYLAYNPAATAVKTRRAANAQRQADWRDRRHGEAPADASAPRPRNGVTNTSPDAPRNTPPSPSPAPAPARPEPGRGPEYEVPLTAVSGPTAAAAAPSPATERRAAGKLTRVAAVVEALRGVDLAVHPTPRDAKAIHDCRSPPETIAEAYAAAYRGTWGDDWLRENLSLHLVVDRLAGYQASRQPQPRRRRPGEAPLDPAEYLRPPNGRLSSR